VTTDVVPSPKTFAGIPLAPVRQTQSNVNILIYGMPGVGKTFLAATADHVPAMRPVIYLNIEGGDMTLRHAAPEIRKVPAEGSLTWPQFEQVYDVLARQCYNGAEPDEYKPRTVIIDTGTEVQKMNMQYIMGELVTSEPDKYDLDVPDIRRWGKNGEQMRRWIRRYRDLPLNVIMCAHEQIDKDNMTGLTMHKPQFSGKLAQEVAGFFDIVVYLYVKTEERDGQTVPVRKLLTGSLEGYVAKDRSGNLPHVVEDPTMQTIFEYVTEGISKKTA
jgi:AAA domain